ncbi:MAG TPA: DnaJ domain-containing protein [Spirochaetia bacterium]|nr:DnaJ domain-containing protein [Spirochaetia bacterium]
MTLAEARRILRLATRFSDTELRDAYRVIVKEFHPDIARDKAMAHLHMIEINQAYNLLRRDRTVPSHTRGNGGSASGDYELYRSGIDVLRRIHPSEWLRVSKDGLFDPAAIERLAEDRDAFQAAIQRTGEAYRIFSELIRDYPGSMWAPDARDKLKTLDTMIIRYKKMMENYS